MMTTNSPEVVAWRWRKPVVNDQGETVGVTNWVLSETPEFLPWWTNEPLIRLSDYEALQAAYEKLLKHLQSLIDQTTPLVPEPGNPMWSRRVQLDEVIAERDSLQAECEKLRKDAERYRCIRKGNQWVVAAAQTGFHIDGGDLDDIVDIEMGQQK